MYHSKKVFAAALALLLALTGLLTTAFAVEVPQPGPLLYVTDNANVLSTETENYIANCNDALSAATGAQFAVLTIESLPSGYDSESYCYEVFNSWGIGSAEKNNGLLLLLVPPEGKFWMVTGTGLQAQLSGGVLSDLLDDCLADDFDAGRYDRGVTNLFDAVWEKLEDIYGPIDKQLPAGDYGPDGSTAQPVKKRSGLFGWVIFLLILVLVVVLIAGTRARPGRRYYRRRAAPPPPPPGAPPYYRTYNRPPPPPPAPPRRRPPSPPPGGGFGGFGGGSSSSRSGGSRSFGGGHSYGGGSGRSSGGSRPSSSGRSFGGGGHSSGGSRSFGGGRSHGGGGGRR